jgi:hypothetical protein
MFTKSEEEVILANFGSMDLSLIAGLLEGPHELCQIEARFKQVLNPKIRKGDWTSDEDQLSAEWAEAHKGPLDWTGFGALCGPLRILHCSGLALCRRCR